MDPLSALAIATTAAQFLEFGTNLVSGTFERYEAVAGATESHIEIESAVSRLQDLVKNVWPPSQVGAETPGAKINPQHGRQLESITHNCQDVADQLIALLAELKATGEHKLVGSLLATFKAIRKEKKVQQLHRRLLSAQSELSLCLVSPVYDNNHTVAYALEKLERTRAEDIERLRADDIERSSRSEVQHSNIVYALDDLPEKSEALKLHCSSTLTALTRQLECQLQECYKTKRVTEHMQETLIRLSEEAQLRRSQLRILESHMDPVIKMRESSINNAHAETYNWMLLRATENGYPEVRFLEWLTEETGVF